MKINIFQKILLASYGALFVYFAIIHVPFKLNSRNEIEYDTLFSNKSNLDVSRLVLIILVITIVAGILFFLLRNISFKLKLKDTVKRYLKPIMYVSVGVVILLLSIFAFNSYQNTSPRMPTSVGKIKSDTTKVVDSLVSSEENTPPFLKDLKKIETCTKENALRQFKSYMKFYYPDWKIFGTPVVQETSDCIYGIHFTTINPSIRYEKEVIVVEISFNYDYSKYYFRTIRGVLY